MLRERLPPGVRTAGGREKREQAYLYFAVEEPLALAFEVEDVLLRHLNNDSNFCTATVNLVIIGFRVR